MRAEDQFHIGIVVDDLPAALEQLTKLFGYAWCDEIWSDDVAADSAALVEQGWATEAVGHRQDGTPYWSFHRSATGPRIELVSRDVQAGMEQYWAGRS